MTDTANALKIFVSTREQRLYLLRGGQLLREWPCSTSGRGLGEEEGSLRTPRGRHVICQKIGGDAPLGMVFKGRVPQGVLGDPADPEDLVLTRILWLGGQDTRNANTRQRYVYIHGTNHEQEIGRPNSHGCVRMRNADVAELYDLVAEGTEVLIAS